MTIGSALASALSGLTVSARLAEIASNNIANALNDGFAKKQAVVTARMLGDQGAGARVQGVTRSVDELILGDLRLATAAHHFHQSETTFLQGIDTVFGTAEDEGAISNRIAGFEAALTRAQSRPDSDPRLQSVVDAAKWVASGLNDVSKEIQTSRQAAETRISGLVSQLNSDLQRIGELNAKITRISTSGRDSSAIEDQRQQVIDRLASVVPLREEKRPNGAIALFSSGGLVLLDGRAAEFGFTPNAHVMPDETIGSGLSALTFNGQEITLNAQGGRLGVGELTAQFDLRDRLAPQAQAHLDGLARDLVERLQDPAVDPTLGGAAGLFTDAGTAFAAANETGLSGRIAVNAAVSPEAGGALWRLRAGIGAASPGDPGDATILLAMGAKVARSLSPASAALSGQSGSVAELASGLSAGFSVSRLGAERAQSFAATRHETLKAEHLENGVDTDEEMQTLLLIEQAYAANARVIQAADAMMQSILEI